jgi:hypothetical protein
MFSPKKPSGTNPRPPSGIGPQDRGSSNGQQPELHFDYAIDESGRLEIGSAGFSRAAQDAIPGASFSSGVPEGPLSRGELWMRRLSLVLFVVVCVWVGLILVVLPWTHVWTDNGLLLRNLSLRSFASLNFVRGVVSGLGFINVWMGISEAVHYREPHNHAA